MALLTLAGGATAQPLSGRQIKEWIVQLHDSGYSKRNAAVQALAHEPETALPLLKQELKRETDFNRQWWLKAAIQQCEEQLPKPEEISASPDRSERLHVCEACKTGDGPFAIVEHDGVRCWQTPKRVAKTWSYLYFIAEDSFRQKAGNRVEIQLEFLDEGSGEIELEYNSSVAQAPHEGAYKSHSLVVHRTNTKKWRTVRFRISDARFRGSENGRSDFRFYNGGDDLPTRSVRVWPL